MRTSVHEYKVKAYIPETLVRLTSAIIATTQMISSSNSDPIKDAAATSSPNFTNTPCNAQTQTTGFFVLMVYCRVVKVHANAVVNK